jgi:hypothetical protein
MKYEVKIEFKPITYDVTADTKVDAKKLALEEYDTNDDSGNIKIKDIIITREGEE